MYFFRYILHPSYSSCSQSGSLSEGLHAPMTSLKRLDPSATSPVYCLLSAAVSHVSPRMVGDVNMQHAPVNGVACKPSVPVKA
jgi:hypothetical protein